MKDFSWCSCNYVLFSIQMSQLDGYTSQGLQKSDFFDMNEISSSALEKVMLFYSDAHVNVPCNDSGLS